MNRFEGKGQFISLNGFGIIISMRNPGVWTLDRIVVDDETVRSYFTLDVEL